jgi:serine/arginine repetitive matrix protein 1
MSSTGISYQQDPFHKNRQKKLFASRSWPEEFSQYVDMSRVSIESLRPWVEKRITELIGNEDEIIYEYCIAQLEAFDPVEKSVDPREIQVNLEGFLGDESASRLMRELWKLMISAQSHPLGIPQQILDEQKLEEERKKREAEELRKEIERRREGIRRDHEETSIKRDRDERRDKEPTSRRRRSPSKSRSRSRDRRARRDRSRDRNYRR